MASRNPKTIRAQLEATLKKFKEVGQTPAPSKGWLRAVRDALGMNGRQFAARLGVSPARISKLESDEVAGAVSLNTLRKAAEALDCVLVYGLVPKSTLENTVKQQASRWAAERLARTSHTMALEDQELSSRGKEQAMNELIEQALFRQPKNLWDK